MTTSNKLTDLSIKKSLPADRPYKLSDGCGLFLLVHSNGSRYLRMAYRFAGKQKLLALGVYPGVSLAAARQKREDARSQIAQGIDPCVAKKDQEAVEKNTFVKVAAEWMEYKKVSRFSERHADRVWRSLEQDVFPYLGHLPVAEISTKQIAAVIKNGSFVFKLTASG